MPRSAPLFHARAGAFWLSLLLAALLAPTSLAAKYDGTLSLSVVDEQTGKPLAVRMRLHDGRGRPVRVRSKGSVAHGDYLSFDGEVILQLRRGKYRFDIEAGPEFHTRQGNFTIDRHAEDAKSVSITRIVNMQKEGWWAGDLDVQHRSDHMRLLMRAEHVDFAPVLTQRNVQGKCKTFKDRSRTPASELTPPLFGPWATLDRRRGGGLLLFGSAAGIDLCDLPADGSSLSVVQRAHDAGGPIVALTPFAWDLPLWLASGQLDAIQIIHRHALADGVVDNEAWGRPRDKTFFPGKLGNGRWSEAIYQHVLNCGLRVPPAAGSGSGTNKNPIGTGRVYAYCGDQFSREHWWQALRGGRVVVTNGPLLRVNVEGHPPGHLFQLDQDRQRAGPSHVSQSREFQIGLKLSFYTKSPVDYLEIVKNGHVVYEVRLDELVKRQGRLPALKFDDSGWFLVRAITANSQTYQFASTGPYYVESNYGPRISRTSVQFFLDWLDEAAKKFAGNQAVQTDIAAARPFWQDLLKRANAE